jgi:predicted dehydrogenase
MSKLKAAIIGAGFIGPVHLEALRRLGIPVTGVLGSTPESSERAAGTLGLPRAYYSLEELLADKEVRVVHITSPNRVHFAQASAALRAGKHVMCEKPLASPEVRPFISLPGGHNEGHHDTFKHLFRTFYDYLRAGDLTAPAAFPTFADGHREIGVCEAILRSHRERAWVDMKE